MGTKFLAKNGNITFLALFGWHLVSVYWLGGWSWRLAGHVELLRHCLDSDVGLSGECLTSQGGHIRVVDVFSLELDKKLPQPPCWSAPSSVWGDQRVDHDNERKKIIRNCPCFQVQIRKVNYTIYRREKSSILIVQETPFESSQLPE